MKVGDRVTTKIQLPSGKKVTSVAICSFTFGEDGEHGYTLHFPNCHAYFNGDGEQITEQPNTPIGVVGHGSIGAGHWSVLEALQA